jgi:hypothetical protein
LNPTTIFSTLECVLSVFPADIGGLVNTDLDTLRALAAWPDSPPSTAWLHLARAH